MKQEDVLYSLEELGVNVRVYNKVESELIIDKLVKRYCTSDRYAYPLWENLKNSTSYYSPEGWKLIRDYFPDSRKLFFVEPMELNVIFDFENSFDIFTFLNNSVGFVFYLTNVEQSYLICFNDHDFLIGTGNAGQWVDSQKYKS